jgi:S-adenosylmethionine:tRNA ribosyltransferase-isomerase
VQLASEDFHAWLNRCGEMPIPPYLQRNYDSKVDDSRYQTVYAKSGFAVAAPTAGLHFTPEILTKLAAQGVDVVPVTLNVGRGTFLPIRVPSIDRHRMHQESYRITPESWQKILDGKKRGAKIWAVGTTTVRALESFAIVGGIPTDQWLSTELFIAPGFSFKLVDHLLTNYHQPKSSLFVMLAAFCGLPQLRKIYSEAMRQEYRMLSYGDCMLVL